MNAALRSLFERLVYPGRDRAPEADWTEDEIEAWVETADVDYFTALDDAFVERARSLGVESGMILDLGSRLGLIPLRILWEEEDFYAIGLHRSPAMADRARSTAGAWELGERLFIQIGEPRQMRFKTDYFDMVVSDVALHRFDRPDEVMREVARVAKPSGAILIRDLRRPHRLQAARHIESMGRQYDSRLRPRLDAAVRAGFTPWELERMALEAGIERARVTADDTHVTLERAGTTDLQSWVTERDKYF